MIRKVVCGILVLLGVCCILDSIRVAVIWKKTEGTVVSMRISRKDDDGNPTRYSMVYKYTADGREYYGEGNVDTDLSKVGSSVAVYYSTMDVSHSTTAQGAFRVVYIGIAYIVLGLFVFALIPGKQKKAPADNAGDDDIFSYFNCSQGFYL